MDITETKSNNCPDVFEEALAPSLGPFTPLFKNYLQVHLSESQLNGTVAPHWGAMAGFIDSMYIIVFPLLVSQGLLR